jgi:hypothetical protein
MKSGPRGDAITCTRSCRTRWPFHWFTFVEDALFYDPNLLAGPASPLMGTHLSGANATDAAAGITADGLNGAAIWHRLNGVFWAAFLLFSITTASIVSGAVTL